MVIAVLFLSLFVFAPQLADNFGTIKLLASGVGCMALVLSLGFDGVRRSSMWRPILIFLAAILLSWWFSVDREMGILGAYNQPFFGVVIALQCVAVFSARVAVQDLSDWTVVAILVQSVVCVSQRHGYPSWGLVDGRAVGTIGNPAFLGCWVAVTAPLCWRSRWKWLGLLGSAYIIYATRSRGAACAVVLGAVLVWNWRYALILCLALPLVFTQRKHNSDMTRLITWKVAVRAAVEHPVLGWGPNTFSIANRRYKLERETLALESRNTVEQSADNDVLEAWSMLGTVGLLAYGFLLWKIWGRLRVSDPVLAVSLISLFIQAKVNPIPNAGLLWAAAVLSCVS